MVSEGIAIGSIAAGGDGVGRADGLAVFIPRTAPGDVVDATLDIRGRFARGDLVRLTQASPERVEPPCLHYTRDRCGGCQLQHMRYESQLRAKSTIIRDAMERIGKRSVAAVDVHPSPSEWAYRTKLTLALRWVNDQWIAGLHPFDNPDAVFPLAECLITDDRVLAVWRAILSAGELLPRAKRLRGAVRLTEDGASFVLEGGVRWISPERFAGQVPALTTVWWEPLDARKRLVVDRRTAREAATESQSKPGAPDASFVQVNAGAASLLHAHVVAAAMAHRPESIIDAYAGAGATAVPLAERGVRVTAIELDPTAARWVGAHLPAGSRAIVARVEDSIGDALPADVVILNPPRAGVDARVTATLQDNPPRAIVYVSCNPATLARDVQRLSGFRIANLTAFDLFPQTAHVETVCELIPEAA